MEERAIRLGAVTEDELEGSKPDWHGEFLQWKNKKERMGLFATLEQDGLSIFDFVKLLAGRTVVHRPKEKKK